MTTTSPTRPLRWRIAFSFFLPHRNVPRVLKLHTARIKSYRCLETQSLCRGRETMTAKPTDKLTGKNPARQSRSQKGVKRSLHLRRRGGDVRGGHAIGLNSVSLNNDRQTFAQAEKILNHSSTKRKNSEVRGDYKTFSL